MGTKTIGTAKWKVGDRVGYETRPGVWSFGAVAAVSSGPGTVPGYNVQWDNGSLLANDETELVDEAAAKAGPKKAPAPHPTEPRDERAVGDFDALVAELKAAGWENTGGGNDFTSWIKNGRDVYVFSGGRGSGPKTSHWVEVVRHSWFVAGGFDPAELREYIRAI
jgi:hypothetical protein